MSQLKTISDTYQRMRSLQTHRITRLPIAILMPHSACNCRCVMCDIWKGNANLKQLTENDVRKILDELVALGTQLVLFSGGEALLNPHFFSFCRMIKAEGMRICVLSTGLTLEKYATDLANWVDEIIVSIDGEPVLHNKIRNIPGAFEKMANGIRTLKEIKPEMKISARTVIHRLNFRNWDQIVFTAKEIGLNSISFLPADVSSQAFNRETPWTTGKQEELLLNATEIDECSLILEQVIKHFKPDFENGFIAESPEKLRHIIQYYAASLGLTDFPKKKCNAPWVSAVVEADGLVRPCFFHEPMGSIQSDGLRNVVNGDAGIHFRKELDMDKDETCRRCVCSLYLKPTVKLN